MGYLTDRENRAAVNGRKGGREEKTARKGRLREGACQPVLLRVLRIDARFYHGVCGSDEFH